MDKVLFGCLVLSCLVQCLLLCPRCYADGLIRIASYSTSIEDQEENVKKNLRLAAERLNGHLVVPGAVFSFNEVVGEGSAKNGYVQGRVLYTDEVRYEPGGGLCQASSTLYNAFLVAGFVIVERHRHHQPVSYVPLGLDATIKYGKKDLKMRNPYDYGVSVGVSVSDKSLTVVLSAETRTPYRYELQTDVEEMQLPLLTDSRKVRNGITIYVNRQKYSGNDLLGSTLLYKDYFPPVYVK